MEPIQTAITISHNVRYIANNVNVTFVNCYNALLSLIQYCNATVPSALAVLSYMVAAVSKRGNVSDRFVVKFVDGVRADTGAVISGNQFTEIIKNIWRQLGSQITPEIAAALFNLWPRVLPNESIRMRTTLNQAANQGMTAFLIIGRAVRAFGSFDWHRICSL